MKHIVFSFVMALSAAVYAQQDSLTLPVYALNTGGVVSQNSTYVKPLMAEAVVYITRTGNRYHKQHCPSTLGREVRTTTLAEAQRVGLTPCQRCHSTAE